MTNDSAVEMIAGSAPDRLLLICDHASNRVPPDVAGGDLGLPAADMDRHIAYDIGARGVTLALARELDAPAVLSRFSRLVIDPNRGEDDPTLIMQLYDGSLIPANRGIDAADVAHRIRTCYRPYHARIGAVVDELATNSRRPPGLISVHSFTPQLRGGALRPWHVGVLSAADRRIADPLLSRLRTLPGIVVGDNQPYSGALTGDCLGRHGLSRGLPHVLIELRNDLIADAAGQAAWAARLAPILRQVFDAVSTERG